MGISKQPRKTGKNPNPDYTPPGYVKTRGVRRRLRLVDRDYLARICDARDVLCGYCSRGDCLMCTVHHLVADAFSEINDVEVDENA